ncbi:MAG TPA: energy transducer TonB [Pyrinomonadaceae bacterium]
MPRLPISNEQVNGCIGQSAQNYAAYHDGVAYVVKIVSKIKTFELCTQKKKFDESSFAERVAEIKTEIRDASETGNNILPDSVIKLNGTTGTVKVIKLINDYKNKRWFELSVYGADERNEKAKDFLDSLATDKTGIEIGSGAERVFGDDSAIIEQARVEKDGKTETVKKMLVKINDRTEKGVAVILKTRAIYTEAARNGSIQGKVVLRVTFQANGAIGDVSVISGLPRGLTEAAIAAARKIVFIPGQRNGERFSVSKPVEYTFTIY